MVDARIVQTTKALNAAIVELASHSPVSSISVADVTRAAGINRATFYSHATSPGALLAELLTSDLEAIRAADDTARDLAELDARAITRKSMERVVEHVVNYRDVYRLALPDPLDASTHRALARHFEESALRHFERHPSRELPEGVSMSLAAGFVAHGLVGVIENWLTGKKVGRKALVDTILLLLPTWWD